MNRADRRAQWRSQNRARLIGVTPNDCRGGTPWPPPFSRMEPVANVGRPRSAAPTVAREISLHIDELVLHGFPMQARHSIGDATQLELTRLLSAGGLPEFVSDTSKSDAIDGGSFHVTPHAKPNAVGSLIAKAVYGGRRR
jgi:hypothetical protein